MVTPIPRGIRNNNPGNIRMGSLAWKGLTGNDGTFCTFDTPENGIRAIARILMTYQNNYHLKTISEIINHWAPSNENNTDAYIDAVASQMRLQPDQVITPNQYPDLITAIIQHENGQQPYAADQILTGIKNALAS